MRTKVILSNPFLILCVYICVVGFVTGAKFKRKVESGKDISGPGANYTLRTSTETNYTQGRGFLTHGGLFSLGKVLNFFPVGGEKECKPTGFNIASAGICLNPYDCRQRDGKASGDCAHGLGVCCVFEVSCGGVVQNNITYFMSPGFPELWMGEANCSVQIEAAHAGITQLRIDFVHFTIGQPNRVTGECDEDTMVLGEGEANFTLCGQNHGQHIYYTLPRGSETREAGELPRPRSTPLVVTMRGGEMARLWLIRITQMPLAYSSPHNCLQYYTKNNGTIKTFNYASNGRHLAGQEYRSCVRRGAGVCSIRYTPCDRRSFRIGSGSGSGSAGSMGTYDDQDGAEDSPAPDDPQNEEEGSGADPLITDGAPQPSAMSRISGLFSSRRTRTRSRTFPWARWSPYIQHFNEDKLQFYGYGWYGSAGYGRQGCVDRITIPCENEYFVSGQGLGVCDPHHCGNSFCPGRRYEDCSVHTSIIPFAVSVYFGPPTVKRNPEENIGMCLHYSQISCDA